MKKLVTILLIISFNSSIYSQPAKPNKVGQFGDFVGVVKFGGMLEGTRMFTIYSEVIRAEVTFMSGDGIANPPKVNYGRYFELINDIYIYGAGRPYVVAVKAKSVLQKNWGRGGFDLVWTPIKITLISTCSSLEIPNDEQVLEVKKEGMKLESLSPNVILDIIGKSIKIGNLEVAEKDFPNTMTWDDAKKACKVLGDGWRLPTIDELNTLYINKDKFGGFADKYCWSSTEYTDPTDIIYSNMTYSNNWAWVKYFVNGKHFTSHQNKNSECLVRAVRAF